MANRLLDETANHDAMKYRRLLPILVCLPCMAFAAEGEKKITDNTPIAPVENYDHAMALSDFSSLPERKACARLQAWLLTRCFGGASPDNRAMHHPRVAQALWLAVTTDALGRNKADRTEALVSMDHLLSQKAIDATTSKFFKDLWNDHALGAPIRNQRAADFLRAWLAPWKTPALLPAESKAIMQALQAGVGSLDFLSDAADSPPSEKK